MSVNANGDDNGVIIHARVSRRLHTGLRACLLLWKPEHQNTSIFSRDSVLNTVLFIICVFLQLAMGCLHIDQRQSWLAAPQGCNATLIF